MWTAKTLGHYLPAFSPTAPNCRTGGSLMTPNYTESKLRIINPDVKQLNLFCRGENSNWLTTGERGRQGI